jgi:hypothetical protein
MSDQPAVRLNNLSSHEAMSSDYFHIIESKLHDLIFSVYDAAGTYHVIYVELKKALNNMDLGELQIYDRFYDQIKLYLQSPDSTFITLLPFIDIRQNTNAILTAAQENIVNQRRMLELRNKFTPKLIQLIQETDFEYGIETQVDTFVRERMSENSVCTKSWLNDIFLENYLNPSILTGILRVISRFDYADIYPEGQTMALAAISHVNSEVQECGIRAFEHWHSLHSLYILERTKGNTPWLQEYIDLVIEDLQKEYDVTPSKKN